MDGTATIADTVRVGRAGPVATIHYDRPGAYNSFDVKNLERLLAAVQDVCYDPSVRAVVLTGAGKVFCTGADITEMKARKDDAPRLFDDLTLHYHALVAAMRGADKVFVTALNGIAAGGGVGLALSADLVVADPKARLRLAYADLGVSPDGGASAHLMRILGPLRAHEALLVDEGIDAPTMAAWGLANRVSADGRSVQEAQQIAAKVAARSPVTVKAVKALVEQAGSRSFADTLESERRLIIEAGGGADFREGMTAFLEKRKPKFTGR